MTLDELMKVYSKAATDVAFLQYEGINHHAGIRAVVTALRDEFDKNGSVTWTLHQILASDGVDKAAGGGASRQTESIRPAADRIEALEAEAARLRAALQDVVDAYDFVIVDEYDRGWSSVSDAVVVARKALEDDKQ